MILSCYHPLLMVDDGEINPVTGKHRLRFVGQAYDLVSPDDPLRDNKYIVPCNRCIGCRLDYARDWTNRMLLELSETGKGIFVTLTYNDDHVWYSENTGFKTLNKRDCQLFFKRLRRHFSDKKIRYFLAGEYGSKTFRPHYHAIIFGLVLEDFPDLTFYKKTSIGNTLWVSGQLNTIWENGFCVLSKVTAETCGYTARYMLKKLKGDESFLYKQCEVTPEFTLSSRRPGIGMNFLNRVDVHDIGDKFFLQIDGKSHSMTLPRKLFGKIVDIDPAYYEELKRLRREKVISQQFLAAQQSDLEYLEYLGMQESKLYNRVKGILPETRLDL